MNTIEETNRFIDKEIDNFKNELHNMCNKDDKGRKKAELITYWVKDYIKYLKFEETFTPKKMKEYERGDIIKVNFGFNIGNEEGGLHYALVIDNNNSQSSGVITVVPLSTQKSNETLSKYDVSLGNELYILVNNKFDAILKICEEQNKLHDKEQKELYKEKELITALKEVAIDGEFIQNEEIKMIIKERTELISKKENELFLRIKENTKRIKYANKILKEFDRMNYGSKALVGQITTVSKIRIFDPKHSEDVLDGIRLSSKQLDKVNKKIKELYIFGIDNEKSNIYNKTCKENNAV